MELKVSIATLKAVYIIYLTLLSHADKFWGHRTEYFFWGTFELQRRGNLAWDLGPDARIKCNF